jgi:putative flippase GtrA
MQMQFILNSEKLRFGLVGIFNTGLDFVLLNFFVFAFGLSSLAGNVLSVTICVIISYLLNHHFVFRSGDRTSLKKFLMFFMVTGFSAIILQTLVIWTVEWFTGTTFGRSLILFSTLHDNTVLQLNFAKAAAVGVGMIWNYLLYKYFVFARKVIEE